MFIKAESRVIHGLLSSFTLVLDLEYNRYVVVSSVTDLSDVSLKHNAIAIDCCHCIDFVIFGCAFSRFYESNESHKEKD